VTTSMAGCIALIDSTFVEAATVVRRQYSRSSILDNFVLASKRVIPLTAGWEVTVDALGEPNEHDREATQKRQFQKRRRRVTRTFCKNSCRCDYCKCVVRYIFAEL
jgi:hypothetical protein